VKLPRGAVMWGWTEEKVRAEAKKSGRTEGDVLAELRRRHAPGGGYGPPRDLLGALFERYPLPSPQPLPSLTDPLDFEVPAWLVERGWTPELVCIQAWAEVQPIHTILSEIESLQRKYDSDPVEGYKYPDVEYILAWPGKARGIVASLEDAPREDAPLARGSRAGRDRGTGGLDETRDRWVRRLSGLFGKLRWFSRRW
jgi:hypothetical protein